MLKPDEQGNYLKKDYSSESFPLRLKEAVTSSYIKWHMVILNTFWISNELNQICSRAKNTDFYLYGSTVFKPVFLWQDLVYAIYIQSRKIKISSLPRMHLGVGSLFQNVKFLVHAMYLNHGSSRCHSLRELIMVGYITYIMTGSIKPSGVKTVSQVSRQPEHFWLPWSTEFCTVTFGYPFSKVLKERCGHINENTMPSVWCEWRRVLYLCFGCIGLGKKRNRN